MKVKRCKRAVNNGRTLEAFKVACTYPGRLDEAAVELALGEYLKALNIERPIRRLRAPWIQEEGLRKIVADLAAETVKRAGRTPSPQSAARAARTGCPSRHTGCPSRCTGRACVRALSHGEDAPGARL